MSVLQGKYKELIGYGVVNGGVCLRVVRSSHEYKCIMLIHTIFDFEKLAEAVLGASSSSNSD